MSVEARQQTLAAEWSEWQGSIVKGIYPLQRVLHGSDRSAIFLTEAGPQGSSAAIKIVRADQVPSGPQLQRWRAAAALSHPHLVRLFDVGLCELEGHSFIYLLMEHAEQTLAQLLPRRALSAEEARELLRPILEVLSVLHGRNLVHGQLNPAALLVVNDQLKLASHCIRAAGEPRLGASKPSLYDPPEADGGRLLPPGDVWALGITLVEALTQSLPWPDSQTGSTSLPSLPTEFAAFVRRCLRHNPGSRPTAAELQSQLAGVPVPVAASSATSPAASPPTASPSATSPPAAQSSATNPRTASPPPAIRPSASPRPAASPVAPRTPAPASEPARMRAAGPAALIERPPVTAIVAAVLIAVAVITWAGVRFFHGHSQTAPAPAAVQSSPTPAAAPAVSAAVSPPLTPPTPPRVPAHSKAPAGVSATDSSVMHAQIPAVPRSALHTIRGHIKVAVLVTVDRLGKVADAALQYAGPSPYFARLAKEAARKWQFVPAAEQDSRKWLVTFEFNRDGTTGHATPRS
jgi:TonB family protein